ncbi:hypothetical protein [Novispirillum itersonii]|uniref:Uncharacterized protein n=1 Tax=Novispirillum itersonii TaxID=189 RepID=A0A7W9ZFK3_NOVIT|nr:hypothetical protein [Novispirillum itersonii]MBB6210505.1 hypothetical protein [Novispirillum itersonii]
MTRYEIAIHNADVRRLVYGGDHHRDLADSWSETHYVEVVAETPDQARNKIFNRYPRDRGFVIEAVKEA